MTKSASPESMITRIREDFVLGGHKAAAIAMVMQNAEIYLVSELDPAFAESMFFQTVQHSAGSIRGSAGMPGR